MYSRNLGRPVATSEVTIKHDIRAPRDQLTSRCSILRGLLLGWAFLRLVELVLWTGVIILRTVEPFEYRVPGRLTFVEVFKILSIISQLVEFGMIITFIIAGVKKSASLYRAYYRYCILTLIIYIIAVVLCLALDYDSGYYFGGILYLTPNIKLLVGLRHLTLLQRNLIFVGAATVEIALEVMLILSVKYLINNYSSNQKYAAAENV